jgi:glycerol-3-phosphate dehydrogenase
MEVKREQIVYAYSGIRPLPASDSSNPGLISRDHSSPTLEPTPKRPFSLISLVGGKWTTFRGFAEEVADNIIGRLAKQRQRSTRNLAIGGGRDFPQNKQEREAWLAAAEKVTGLPRARLDDLLTRYGTTALQIGQYNGPWKDADRLPTMNNISTAELAWIVENEAVVSLADLVQRRTNLAMRKDLTKLDIEKIADIFALQFGWTVKEKKKHMQDLAEDLARTNRLKIGS